MTSKAYRENYNLIQWGPDLVQPKGEGISPARSSLPSPYVTSDNLGEPIKHLATGVYSDSKSFHRMKNKELGLVEIGNEKAAHLKQEAPAKLDKRQRKNDIRKAISELRNGRRV
ncbi:MAG: hypothetical protein KF802_16325 [Bdellovibrionaceae bacterium]|nr:hypothetical protein [Pseudobdellovibrionaceae bacterium]